MTNLITKLTTAASHAVLFAAAVIMAGLGFAIVGTLAIFALMAVGVAMVAAPFAKGAQPAADNADADAELAA